METLAELILLREKHKKNLFAVMRKIEELGGKSEPLTLRPLEAIKKVLSHGQYMSFYDLLDAIYEIADIRAKNRRADLCNCIYYAIRSGEVEASGGNIKTMMIRIGKAC